MPRHPPCALRNLVLSYNPCTGTARGPRGHTLHWVLAYYPILSLLLLLLQTARAARGASPRRGGGLPTEIPTRQRTGPHIREPWWSYGDSNPGPPACKAGALAS
jgi:hypothetical protein